MHLKKKAFIIIKLELQLVMTIGLRTGKFGFTFGDQIYKA